VDFHLFILNLVLFFVIVVAVEILVLNRKKERKKKKNTSEMRRRMRFIKVRSALNLRIINLKKSGRTLLIAFFLRCLSVSLT
jgi:hypothetical protein